MADKAKLYRVVWKEPHVEGYTEPNVETLMVRADSVNWGSNYDDKVTFYYNGEPTHLFSRATIHAIIPIEGG